ncbi:MULTISPECIES: hypothetical protein [unclassified Geodermatophilus]|uniref:hypothetical protein n=1 Tax=unclassified Geodermatophilus TaxID=2637632 RepID=UPI003EEC19B2
MLEVSFEYKCEEDDRNSVTADVTAVNRHEDLRYEADDADLNCDGRAHWITVRLAKEEDRAREGDRVDVTVEINEDGDELDSETRRDVEVVDEENGDRDGDHHHDDKDHDDPH